MGDIRMVPTSLAVWFGGKNDQISPEMSKRSRRG